MNIKTELGNNDSALAELTNLLDAGEPIPDELAKRCAALIHDALENDGKLAIGRGRGRPKKDWERLERAVRVAWLLPSLRVEDAAKQVAPDYAVKASTIEKDYKKFGADARSYVKFISNLRAWGPKAEELMALLQTFRDDTGALLSQDEVDKICAQLPASKVATYVQRINDGGIRRDITFLNKVLSPEG